MSSNVSHDIRALQAMDEQAWSDLQGAFSRRIYFFVKKYVSNHQTAEDITQDVFLGAVRGIANFDPIYTLDQFLFGIAKNRVIDHFRKHRPALVPAKGGDSDRSAIWLENMANEVDVQPGARAVDAEDLGRQRAVLAKILKDFVAGLWREEEFHKLQILEYIFVLGGRNKDAAARFGVADEKAIAGVKFRAIDKLRGLARQADPNHSLFKGLWKPGAR